MKARRTAPINDYCGACRDKAAKMRDRYFKTCDKCGANLDPGERCDCEEATGEERAQMNASIIYRPCKQKETKGQQYAS